jgi:putative sugar O-methyltransferase
MKQGIFHKILWKKISSYSEVCRWALLDDFIFSNFKKHPRYRAILEHVSADLGKQYIEEILKNKNLNIIQDREKLSQNDIYGNPKLFDFADYGIYSPTTLRYAKIISDIIEIFKFSNKNRPISIVEIGVGYGGQCLLLDSFLDIHSYTLVDISPALNLAKSYLERFILQCELKFLSLNEISSLESDLIISNYAFSELNRELQNAYINKIILNAKNGYITYNHITGKQFRTYTADEFIDILPFHALKRNENPLSYPGNVIITWADE